MEQVAPTKGMRRLDSAPGETRTHNLGIRSALLYPVELRGLIHDRPDAIINSAPPQLSDDL